MSGYCRLTVLAGNTVRQRGLLAEHGLSLWLDYGGKHLLLDTGQGLVLSHNAERLGVCFGLAQAIVLSHGHYDHTGRLAAVLAQTDCPVYAHPAALVPKYARSGQGVCRCVGIAEGNASALGESGRLRSVLAPTEVFPGLCLTGPVPRARGVEDVETPFCLDESGSIPDRLEDDQALYYRATEGVVVVLGCAHSGVVNTLHHIRTLCGGSPIHTVIGGMHLGDADDERIEWTVRQFREFGVEQVVPMHCTGHRCTQRLWQEYGDRCLGSPVGSSLDLPAPLA